MSTKEGRLAGRVAVGTGGASGAGAAICREFVEQGAVVVIADRNLEGAQSLAQQLGETAAYALAVDITDSASVDQLAREVRKHCDASADILVNNAGVRIVKPLLEHTDA